MKTSDQILRELADREAIRDLPILYCDCVWRGDLDGIANLFSPNGSFTVKGREREVTTTGREALRKMYEGALGELNPRPYIHNHVVQLKGDGRATGRCYVELRSAARNFDWVGTGFYDDEYERIDSEWKFKSRSFRGFAMPQRAGER